MRVIEFQPKQNHVVAEEYASVISDELFRRTGLRCTVEYQFNFSQNNRCGFVLHYGGRVPPLDLGPQTGILCSGPFSRSAVAAVAEIPIEHISNLVNLLYSRAPEMTVPVLIEAFKNILGECVQDTDQLYKFIMEELTGRKL